MMPHLYIKISKHISIFVLYVVGEREHGAVVFYKNGRNLG